MADIKCNICYDRGTEKLIRNKYCPCKYRVHDSCWKQYIEHCNKNNKNVTCITCRITIKLKPTNIIQVRPSAPPSDFNYQEFQDSIIVISNIPNTLNVSNTPSTPTSSQNLPRNTDRIMFNDLTPQEKKERLIKAVIAGVLMLVVMIVIIVLFT
jgi:hypothetical protein